METSAPGWYPDPTGRHQYRYWTGRQWSAHVAEPPDRTGRRSFVPGGGRVLFAVAGLGAAIAVTAAAVIAVTGDDGAGKPDTGGTGPGPEQDDDPLTALTPQEVPTFATAGLDCLPDDALVTYLAATWDPQWFGGIPTAGARCVYEGFIGRWYRRLTVSLYGRLVSPGEGPPAMELANDIFNEPVDGVIAECQERFPPRASASR